MFCTAAEANRLLSFLYLTSMYWGTGVEKSRHPCVASTQLCFLFPKQAFRVGKKAKKFLPLW